MKDTLILKKEISLKKVVNYTSIYSNNLQAWA